MKNHETISLNDTSIAFASKSDSELKSMRFLFRLMNWEHLTKIGTKFVKSAISLKLPIQIIIKKTLFKQFCGGENLQECLRVASALKQSNIHTFLDYSVESQQDESSFTKATDVIKQIIDLSTSEAISFTVIKITSISATGLLEKIQSGIDLSPEETASFERVKHRLESICNKAHARQFRIMIDAEESWIQGTIDALAYSMMAKYNIERAVVYNTYQMYRSDMFFNLFKALEMAQKAGFILGAKLVRGAYLEKEQLRADKIKYPSPVFEKKSETDQAFNKALELCIENMVHVAICCGSHNEETNLYLTQLMHRKNIPNDDQRVYFSQLYGMGDHISYNLANAGYNVGKYVPFGPLDQVLPYLFRRAEENKAMTGQTSRELTLINKEIARRKQSTNHK